MGVEGAAYGTAMALVFYNVSKFIFVFGKLGLQPPFPLNTFKVLLIAVVTALINMALPPLEQMLFDIVYRSTLITVVFGSLVVTSRSSKEVNTILTTLISKVKGIVGR